MRRRRILDRASISICFISGPTRSGSVMRARTEWTTEPQSHRAGRFDGLPGACRRLDRATCLLGARCELGVGSFCVSLWLCGHYFENTSNTLPGMPRHSEYPEFVTTSPSAIAGPAASIEPPFAGTPLTVV